MRQWREVKSRHRDDLVFFRVGDFYELFCEDAEEGSRLLGLTLTSRNNGAAAGVPLAGVPAKALDHYLERLVKLGRKVAICEQTEDPAEARGIVRREVVETVTPGTVVADALLEAERNNFVVALVPDGAAVGLAALDVSTGEMILLETDTAEVAGELERLEPRELLMPESAGDTPEAGADAVQSVRADWLFDVDTARDELERRYVVQSLDGFGFEAGDELLVRAAGALVAYAEEIRPGSAEHLRAPRIQRPDTVMTLDSMTRRNLELVEPLRPYDGDASLLSVLDATTTPMGARLLRTWLLNPLLDAGEIRRRQGGVAELFEDPEARAALRTALRKIRDLDRLGTKIGSGRATPRDVLALGQSLEELPALGRCGEGLGSEAVAALLADMDTLGDVAALIAEAIAEEAPAALADGGVIREGFSEEVDELRAVRDGARDFIARLQTSERERTGISSLKVGFNKVFGYYLEVTRANLSRVPERFIRKQTLANAERYFTLELKEWEEKVFDADDRIARLEQTLFLRVRGELSFAVPRIQEASRRVAELDVLTTLAEVAEKRGYVRPEVTTDFDLRIEAGRHPVVETMMPREEFIPNDLELDEEGRIVILTGPNMAGKSTVLRQVGLIQLMAQTGSFVPADSARLGVCDRVFTRVGASDNLARGQSTFMVEMSETAAIIHGATERSLVLLDEIGRGTSTYDGVSIAWAVTEHLHESVGAKGICATHYHELTQLGDQLPAVRNLNVSVRESGNDIVFLRRLEEGGADRSYGIQVARLAGFPPGLIARAMELLAELEGTHSGGGSGLGRKGTDATGAESGAGQLSLFETRHPVVDRLRALDPDRMTPLEALNVLHALRAAVAEGR
ncbi:MAG: DNA mismatch repair protein MutS [Gemmatimonadetes bacterium]|nr:DNA mismatch repair protein MutS [Gemmatimonadota bacterium]MYB97169.1 DNA mismatch repair protein MutS [Gemmatimonadota bacterium]MYI47104.1 DNA mismatch repair protein MutS [Gemmatimonadota bacterium]